MKCKQNFNRYVFKSVYGEIFTLYSKNWRNAFKHILRITGYKRCDILVAACCDDDGFSHL